MFQNLGIKILCLLIALLLWLQAAATTEVEEIVELPVAVAGLADSLTVVRGELPSSISVRVRGNRLQLMAADLFRHDTGRVQLDLAGLGPGHHRYDVSVLDVSGPGTPLDVVPGVSLDVHVQRLVTRRVPVDLVVEGGLPEGVVFVTDLDVAPATVAVTGAESLVEPVSSVSSKPLNLSGRRASFSERIGLVAPGADLELRPVEVEVSAGIEAVGERVFDGVPPTVLREENDRTRIELVPPLARVVVTGAQSVLDALTVEDISVIVTIEPGLDGVSEVDAEAVVPDDVISARVEPPTFQVLAGVER